MLCWLEFQTPQYHTALFCTMITHSKKPCQKESGEFYCLSVFLVIVCSLSGQTRTSSAAETRMRVPWLLPLFLPCVRGSLDACAEVTFYLTPVIQCIGDQHRVHQGHPQHGAPGVLGWRGPVHNVKDVTCIDCYHSLKSLLYHNEVSLKVAFFSFALYPKEWGSFWRKKEHL